MTNCSEEVVGCASYPFGLHRPPHAWIMAMSSAGASRVLLHCYAQQGLAGPLRYNRLLVQQIHAAMVEKCISSVQLSRKDFTEEL